MSQFLSIIAQKIIVRSLILPLIDYFLNKFKKKPAQIKK